MPAWTKSVIPFTHSAGLRVNVVIFVVSCPLRFLCGPLAIACCVERLETTTNTSKRRQSPKETCLGLLFLPRLSR